MDEITETMTPHLRSNVDRLNKLSRKYGWDGNLLSGSVVRVGNCVEIILAIFLFSPVWRIVNGRITRNSYFRSLLCHCLDLEES